MANDVDCVLALKGPDELLDRVQEECSSESKPLDFDRILPEPDGPDRKSWRERHWGTKRNPGDWHVDVSRKTSRLRYSFETAWDPPLPVVWELVWRYGVDAWLLYSSPEVGNRLCHFSPITGLQLTDEAYRDCADPKTDLSRSYSKLSKQIRRRAKRQETEDEQRFPTAKVEAGPKA